MHVSVITEQYLFDDGSLRIVVECDKYSMNDYQYSSS